MKKEKKIAISLIAGSILLLNFSSVKAQLKDTLVLEEVVITATRSEKNPDEVARSITVITNDQIKKSGANTVAELLVSYEGIYIAGAGQNPGQLQSIYMRGANNNQVSILIDGIRVTDPSSTDNGIDLSELSLLGINKIEIVRGSHSTLYGSSAIGGVINIITNKSQSPGMHMDAELRAGKFGSGTSLFSENFSLNYTSKSGFYGGAEWYNNNTRGLNATIDTSNLDDYKDKHRDRDGFVKRDLIGRIGYKTWKWDVFASYKNVDQQSDIDKGAFNDDDNYIIALRRNLITCGARYKIHRKINLSYVGGITNLNRMAEDDSSIVDVSGNYDHTFFRGNYQGATSTHEAQVNYQSKSLSIVSGATFFNERMTFDSYYFSGAYGIYESKEDLDTLNINVTIVSQFIHAGIDGSLIGNKYKALGLDLGIRNSNHRLFGNNITCEINPSLKISENGLLFASWSTGFNAPSLYQLYSPNKDVGSGITRGNKSLKPETSTSLEVGFKQKVNDRISYSVSYFKTIVNNSIDYVYLWDRNKPVDSLSYLEYRGDTYLNIGTQTNQGIEIAIQSAVTDKLVVSANLSLISGRLDYNPATIDALHTQGNHVQLFGNGAFVNKEVSSIGLVRRPSTANLNATYKLGKKIAVGSNVRYVGTRNDIFYDSKLGPYGALGSQSIGDYVLVDVLANCTIGKGVSAVFRISNILNQKYYEIYGYTSIPRGFYLSVRYSL